MSDRYERLACCSMQSTGLAGTAIEQSKLPAPLISSESGTGYTVLVLIRMVTCILTYLISERCDAHVPG